MGKEFGAGERRVMEEAGRGKIPEPMELHQEEILKKGWGAGVIA